MKRSIILSVIAAASLYLADVVIGDTNNIIGSFIRTIASATGTGSYVMGTSSENSVGFSTALENNQNLLNLQVASLNNHLNDAFQYTADVAAGSAAMAAIDFGDVSEGHYSVGIGMGYSATDYKNGFHGFAGAAGIKYGYGEVADDVYMSPGAKGWISDSGNYAVGGAVIFDF